MNVFMNECMIHGKGASVVGPFLYEVTGISYEFGPGCDVLDYFFIAYVHVHIINLLCFLLVIFYYAL